MDGIAAEYDFVVVGSGAGSMCAALVMRKAGKSVIIVEKTESIGGTTARAGGVMWIPDNRFMAREGIEDSFDKAMTYLDAVVGDDPTAPGASRERREAYVREAPRMVDFLMDCGVKLQRACYWPDYYDDRPGGIEQGRTIAAELFDVNELGEWKDRLRLNWLRVPASHEEAHKIRSFKTSWRGRIAMAKVGLRVVLGKLTGRQWVTAGAALQGRMLQACLKQGVQFLLNAPVDEIVEQDGAVTGVRVACDGETRTIGARLGVLVNAGGFSQNQEMRDQYQPGTKVEWSNTAPGDTGEMIREMMRHGAAVAQMEEMVGFQVTMPPGLPDDQIRPPMQGTTAAPHAILIDQTGVRYQNEGGSYMAYAKGMLERNRLVPAIPSWAIMDSQCIRKSMLAMAPNPQTLKTWEREGFLRKADSLAELANAIGTASDVLIATIERFNGMFEAGHDADFNRGARAYDRWLGDPLHRPNPTLGKIEEPPFYAMPVYPGDVGTFGGVVTDIHGRVLREGGSVIPGLYATATSTASVMGRAYPGAGSSIGPGFVWGFVAAKHAAGMN